MSGAAQKPAKRRRGGRNGAEPIYSHKLAEDICDRLAAGESLRRICRDPGMPDEKAVRKWAHEDSERGRAFGPQYARARTIGYERLVEDLLEIADDRSFIGSPDANAIVQQQRLAFEARRWLLSKVFPKLYGDKVEIVGDPDAPIVTRIELVPVQPRQLEAKTIEHDANDTSDE